MLFKNTKKLFEKKEETSGNEFIPNSQEGRFTPFFSKEVETKEAPDLNVPMAQLQKGIIIPGLGDKKTAMDYTKRQAILIGIINAINNDIFTKVSFKVLQAKDKGKGRPKQNSEKKEQEAMDFYKKHFVKQTLKSAGYDWLITGEGFLWNGSVSKERMKEILFKLKVSEDDLDPEGVPMIKHIPSTTCSPKYDKKNIIRYDQQVMGTIGEIISFPAANVIHAKYMDLDGKPSGFSPQFAGKPIIETLGMIIDYAGLFFAGGGAPEGMFAFPKEQANSDNFKKAKAEVRDRYSNTTKSGSKRGNLFFAGEVDYKKINDWNKEMEFRKLFVLYAGILAHMYQMPLHRLQSILGADMKSAAGASDLSDSGYWRFIYESQDYWETLLDVGFWNDNFDVDIHFERTYLQDTFRETQATQMSIANIESLEGMDLIKPDHKKSVYSDLLSSIPNEAINDNPKPKQEGMAGQILSNQPSNQNIFRGEATKKLSEDKKKQAGKTTGEKKGM